MNFLAHAYLSGDDADLLFGNFVADSIKGKMLEDYSFRIRQGVTLHREIDYFTDNHLVVKQAILLLRPAFGKYSGVVLDIYFDHFLALTWNTWSGKSLTDYVSGVYKILIRRYAILPPRSRRILPYMLAQNWLVGYANFRDLEGIFKGMTRRSKFESGMENAIPFLMENHKVLETNFMMFFPDLIQFSNLTIAKLTNEGFMK